MRNVVWSLLPICAFFVWQYGVSALASLIVVTAACLAAEAFFLQLGRQSGDLGDWSATITGLLLALTLPPGFPLWMGAVAGFVAIALGKAIFGGVGHNLFNPALVGRAFVQAAFPAAIATYTPSFMPGRFTEFIPSSLALAVHDAEGRCGLAARLAHRRRQRRDAAGALEVRGRAGQQPRPADLRFRAYGGRPLAPADPAVRRLSGAARLSRLANPGRGDGQRRSRSPR